MWQVHKGGLVQQPARNYSLQSNDLRGTEILPIATILEADPFPNKPSDKTSALDCTLSVPVNEGKNNVKSNGTIYELNRKLRIKSWHKLYFLPRWGLPSGGKEELGRFRTGKGNKKQKGETRVNNLSTIAFKRQSHLSIIFQNKKENHGIKSRSLRQLNTIHSICAVHFLWVKHQGDCTADWSAMLLSSTVLCSVDQSGLTLGNPLDCSPPCFSVHEIFQARILSGLPFSPPGESSDPRDQTCGIKSRDCLRLLQCRWILHPLSHQGSPWTYLFKTPKSWFLKFNKTFMYHFSPLKVNYRKMG